MLPRLDSVPEKTALPAPTSLGAMPKTLRDAVRAEVLIGSGWVVLAAGLGAFVGVGRGLAAPGVSAIQNDGEQKGGRPASQEQPEGGAANA